MKVKITISLLLFCVLISGCSTIPKPSHEVQVLLGEGVDPNTVAIVYIKLEGETLPGHPKVVSANDTSAAIFEGIGSREDVRQVAEKKWVAFLVPGESYVIGWIVDEGTMFGYCSEPFVAENNMNVPFSPGMPLSIEINLKAPKDYVHVFPAGIVLHRKTVKNGKTALMSWGSTSIIEKPGTVKIDGLAKGTYQIMAQAIDAEKFIKARELLLFDKFSIEVKPDSLNIFEPTYPDYDTTIEKGDITIKGIVYNSGGEILPDEKIELTPYEGANAMLDLYYKGVVSDENGFFEFTGIRPDTAYIINCVNSGLYIYKTAAAKDKVLWVDYLVGPKSLQLIAGDKIPEFNVVWNDDSEDNFDKFFGKIVVVDVWSSWCVPSQSSLESFNALAQEFKDSNDVVFVAMSTEPSQSTWEKIVNESGWDSLVHGWYDIENSFAFNKPIPYFMLLDKQGFLNAEGNYLDIRAELKKLMETSE